LFTQISLGIDHQLWFVESHIAPNNCSRDLWLDCAPAPHNGAKVMLRDSAHFSRAVHIGVCERIAMAVVESGAEAK